ncbi:MAG: pyridoxamine 5'-phosphate oxidase family protein [Deltaproteobacteria bacterium]|nr:pyridoxamine 5'-phosphate oxidase family protein [Deltaproteobacteria bacterium]
MDKKKAFDRADLKEFEPEAKVGLISTINPEGLPHITLITALQAKGTKQLIWGQFTEGMSKTNVLNNPNTAFLIMTMDKNLWRGKAIYTHKAREGEDYEMFNKKPMFRYNCYCGIHTVYYMDLVETYGKESLPLAKIVMSSLFTMASRSRAKTNLSDPILKPWAYSVFNRLDSLKFLSYIGDDGFPTIIPLIQCQASDSRRLAFSPLAYGEELSSLESGKNVAIFGLTLDMEDVLIRGIFQGFKRYNAVNLGTVDIDWVYNSMPPKQGQIYPVEELRPIVNF